MGWFGDWLRQWRETYEEYPVATAITWGEMLLALGLAAVAVVFLGLGGEVPTPAGVAYLAAGVGFVVWFTVVRPPVMDRLVRE